MVIKSYFTALDICAGDPFEDLDGYEMKESISDIESIERSIHI